MPGLIITILSSLIHLHSILIGMDLAAFIILMAVTTVVMAIHMDIIIIIMDAAKKIGDTVRQVLVLHGLVWAEV